MVAELSSVTGVGELVPAGSAIRVPVTTTCSSAGIDAAVDAAADGPLLSALSALERLPATAAAPEESPASAGCNPASSRPAALIASHPPRRTLDARPVCTFVTVPPRFRINGSVQFIRHNCYSP